jgi:hypothetical protein
MYFITNLYMNSHQLAHTLNECIHRLPVSASLIPLLILCITVNHDDTDKKLSFKTLYTLLHRYSDVGIKNHLLNLRDKGWIRIEQSKVDQRVKHIVGTKKLHASFHSLMEACQ